MRILGFRSRPPEKTDNPSEIIKRAFLDRCAAISTSLNSAIKSIFGETQDGSAKSKAFKEPEPGEVLSHMESTFRDMFQMPKSDSWPFPKSPNASRFIENRVNVLSAAYMTRFVDGYLDKIIWPSIISGEERGGSDLRATVPRFLAATQAVASQYGFHLPFELRNVAELEVSLGLHPEQSNFDESIEELVKRKLARVKMFELMLHSKEPQAQNGSTLYFFDVGNEFRSFLAKESAGRDRYYAQCIAKMVPDVSPGSEATDFKLGHYLTQNPNINPVKLVAFARRVKQNLLADSAGHDPRMYIESIDAFIKSLTSFPAYKEGDIDTSE